jgi:DNA-binding CsgD family transcriptional regulator
MIAQRLDLAPTTVAYHVSRLNDATTVAPLEHTIPSESSSASRGPELAGSLPPTRIRVARLLHVGFTRAQVARELGLSKATVTYHARRLSKPIDERCARRYDWKAVQRYYDEGHSVRACMEAFGFCSASWTSAVRRGDLVARPSATPLPELLVADTYRGRNNLKTRLLSNGLKEGRCERCGIGEWQGRPLILALHHVNGLRNDNRLENLELLCPNCHSQTATFAGRNRPRAPRGRGASADVRPANDAALFT